MKPTLLKMITITLEDDTDISKGDVLARSEKRSEGQQDLDVMLF